MPVRHDIVCTRSSLGCFTLMGDAIRWPREVPRRNEAYAVIDEEEK